jgi:hypothetical protein
MLPVPEQVPALGPGQLAIAQSAHLHGARQTVQDASKCLRTPQKTDLPFAFQTLTPSTPNGAETTTPVPVLYHNGGPATPPESPDSKKEIEPDRGSRKRPCYGGRPPEDQQHNDKLDVRFDDAYMQAGNVFFAESRIDDASLPLSSVATPESYVTDDLDLFEADRAEEDGPGYAFQIEDDVRDEPARREALGPDGLETLDTEVCFGMVNDIPIRSGP